VVGLAPVGVLFGIGLFLISTGLFYGLSMPVQPMKAVSAEIQTNGLRPGEVTVFGLKVADQSLEISQRKAQSTSAAGEQQLINIGTRVLSVACAVPGGCR